MYVQSVRFLAEIISFVSTLIAYGATMGMYGAVGAPATAASARYSEFSSVPQGQPMSSQAGAIPTRSEVAAAEYGAGYGAYGKCNYGGWG
jgi:hypothetical protein